MPAVAKKAPSVQRDMEKELAAATALKAQLIDVLGEENADAITLRDTIEGGTDLFEMVDAVALQIGEDESRADGVKALKKKLDSRAARLNARAESLRAMLINVLDMLGEKKLERSVATISLTSTAPQLVITDEAAIPSDYWKPQDPVLARKELGDDLKARKAALNHNAEEFRAGRITKEVRDGLDKQVNADFPAIPGADLDNGGASLQMRFG